MTEMEMFDGFLYFRIFLSFVLFLTPREARGRGRGGGVVVELQVRTRP